MKGPGRLIWSCLVCLSGIIPLIAQPDVQALDMNPKWNGASYDPGVLRFCDSASWPTSTDCVGVAAAANSAAYLIRLPTTVGLAVGFRLGDVYPQRRENPPLPHRAVR